MAKMGRWRRWSDETENLAAHQQFSMEGYNVECCSFKQSNMQSAVHSSCLLSLSPLPSFSSFLSLSSFIPSHPFFIFLIFFFLLFSFFFFFLLFLLFVVIFLPFFFFFSLLSPLFTLPHHPPLSSFLLCQSSLHSRKQKHLTPFKSLSNLLGHLHSYFRFLLI